MSIIRIAERRRNYTIIGNHVFSDTRLSFKALGVLCQILSYPDNWKVNTKHLSGTRTDGETAIRSAIKELKDCGYIKKSPVRDEQGRILAWETMIYEYPQEQEETHNVENPHSGLSTCGKPGDIISTNSNKDLLDQKLSVNKPHTPEDFDQTSVPPQDLETPIPDSPQDLNFEQPKLDNNPNPVSKNPDREISSAAAPRENVPSPADFAPCAPFYGLPDESAIISVWNAKKGKKWRRMGSGCMNGNMIEGLRHFMSQAGGDKALAVEFLGKAIEVAAQDDWLGTKNIRPSQGLDPFSQMFMGHFLPDALDTDEVKPSPKPVPVPKDFKLTSFVD
jgi:hypothetical protein